MCLHELERNTKAKVLALNTVKSGSILDIIGLPKLC